MTDIKVEALIGNLLQIGVGIALAIVLTGSAFLLINHHAEVEPYSTFRGVDARLQRVDDIWRSAIRMESDGIIQLGLLVLIATPVARVGFALLAFALKRDWLYVLIGGIVLAILSYSLMHGI